MRRIARIDRSFDLLERSYSRTLRASFVCLACRTGLSSASQRAALSTSAAPRAQQDGRDSSGKIPFTEKIRRRIWGTDSPPGEADPYGNLSTFDQTKKREKTSLEPEEDSEEDPEEEDAAGVGPDRNGYVPATTWDGLEQVGGFSRKRKGNRDEEHPFRGFIPPTKLSSKEELTIAVRRAVVEIFTLREAGRPMNDATNARDDRIIPQSSGVNINLSIENQGAILAYPNEEVREMILQSTMPSEPVEEVMEVQAEIEEVEEADKETETTTLLEHVNATPVEEVTHRGKASTPSIQQDTLSRDSSWLNTSLRDPAVKFAIIKRVMQLTGARIPDPTIQQIATVKMLLNHLNTPPKPKKLAEVLSADPRLTGLPNVKMFGRRFTPIDREKEVGRWKVIEKELERRGLPVTGNA
ncbi:MAG: hypothetical protein M1830_005555 [Pleopsidium flavum]|nr:MAG: hypothetical protein M1830_005555 [Pleopsidium flavum]